MCSPRLKSRQMPCNPPPRAEAKLEQAVSEVAQASRQVADLQARTLGGPLSGSYEGG